MDIKERKNNIHSQDSTVIMKNALALTSIFLFTFSCSLYATDAGKVTYDSVCVACHGSGIPGIPQLGDAAGWTPRIEQGNDTLYQRAISGYTGASGIPMPAKGGNPDITDDDVKAAVDYMVANSQGGDAVTNKQGGTTATPAGNEKTKTCAVCHGVDGNSVNPVWPKLAGQHPGYIIKQLKDFHSGARKNVQMTPLAASLSEEDMQNIATYYGSQKIKVGHTSAELLPLGEKIYRAGDATKGLPACMSCHGPNGAGNAAASFPALSGQHAEYTKIQLLTFRDNKRTNDISKAMQIVSEKMTTDEIDAVSNYIQGLY